MITLYVLLGRCIVHFVDMKLINEEESQMDVSEASDLQSAPCWPAVVEYSHNR